MKVLTKEEFREKMLDATQAWIRHQEALAVEVERYIISRNSSRANYWAKAKKDGRNSYRSKH